MSLVFLLFGYFFKETDIKYTFLNLYTWNNIEYTRSNNNKKFYRQKYNLKMYQNKESYIYLIKY